MRAVLRSGRVQSLWSGFLTLVRQSGVAGQPITQAERQGENPLARRHLGQDPINEVGCFSATKAKLEQAPMADEKTGLYNFCEFQRRLVDKWQRAEPGPTIWPRATAARSSR